MPHTHPLKPIWILKMMVLDKRNFPYIFSPLVDFWCPCSFKHIYVWRMFPSESQLIDPDHIHWMHPNGMIQTIPISTWGVPNGPTWSISFGDSSYESHCGFTMMHFFWLHYFFSGTCPKHEVFYGIQQIGMYMDVSENSGTPKSSTLIGFSIINHPFWGTTI